MEQDALVGEHRRLVAALGITACFVLVELVVSVTSGSLALLADAGHQLADAGAIAGSLIALRLSSRPADERWTFGFLRAEVLSAALNGIVLAVVAAVVVTESIRHLVAPSPVAPVGVIAVACAGLFVNLAAAVVLASAGSKRLDVQAVLAHVVTDIWGSAGALGAGIAILVSGYERADAIASLVVAAIMIRTAGKLIRSTGRVLFEGTPEDLSLGEVRRHLLGAEHVLSVHDLHAWVVTSGLPTLSAHVVVEPDCFENGEVPAVLDSLQACLVGHFDLEHSTFQIELPGHSRHELALHGNDPEGP